MDNFYIIMSSNLVPKLSVVWGACIPDLNEKNGTHGGIGTSDVSEHGAIGTSDVSMVRLEPVMCMSMVRLEPVM